MTIESQEPPRSQEAPWPQGAPWWGRIELLWLLAVPLCSILYTLSLPLLPNDFWHHARVGAIIASTGHIPKTNIFASGIPADTPYTYQSWLAEWIFYELLRHAGLAWVIALRSLCIGGTWGFLVIAAYRRCLRRYGQDASPLAARCVALAALIGFLMAASNLETRPQLFSLPLFALFVIALGEWPSLSERATALMPLWLTTAIVVWVNLHGAFFTALLAMSCFLAVESALLLPAISRLPTLGKWRRLSMRSWLFLLLSWGSCWLGALANPLRAGIFPYLWRVSGNATIRRYITEWQPPSVAEWHSAVFFISPLVLALTIVGHRKRHNTATGADGTTRASTDADVGLAEWALLAALGLIACQSVRAIVFYAIAFLPVAAVMLTGALSQTAARRGERPLAPPALFGANAFMAVILCAGILPLLPWFKAGLPWPPAFVERFAPTPRGSFPRGFNHDPELLLDRGTPVEAAAFLDAHPPSRRLFCDMEYGSYLAWALYPQVLPSADPRIEMFPVSFWNEYFRLCGGPANSAQALLSAGYSAALLDRAKEPGLVRELGGSRAWRLVFQGQGADTSELFYAR